MFSSLQEYLHLNLLELSAAILLSLAIMAILYLYRQVKASQHEVLELQEALAVSELDKMSLSANVEATSEVSFDPNTMFIQHEGNNTLLQQELVAYLQKEQQERRNGYYDFKALSRRFEDFLKLRSGAIVLKKSAFGLNEMLDELHKSLRSEQAQSRIELIFDMDPHLPPKLMGDKRHIRLLFFNLLSTIMAHTDAKQLVLVGKGKRVEEEISLSFEVIGWKSDLSSDLRELFLPFSTAGVDDGVTIALAIARGLAGMMHGDIDVQRDSDGKVKFLITLVLAISDPEDSRYYRLPSRSMMAHKILLLIENKVLAKSIANMYRYFKNEVEIVDVKGFEASEEALREYHTVVIEKRVLSLHLVERLRAIKRDHDHNVVLLLSAKEKLEYEVPLGVVDQLLLKPVTIQNVFNSIVTLSEEDDSTENAVHEETGRKLFEDFNGNRLLVVENESMNLTLLRSLLAKGGINLSIAKDAAEALWMIDTYAHFDLLLISETINTMTELPLSQKIRSINRYHSVPLVTMGSTDTQTLAVGVDHSISTPVQTKALFTLFTHYLSLKKAEEEGSSNVNVSWINTSILAARDGYEMASCDEALYSEILSEFIAFYSDSAHKISAALIQDDLDVVKKISLDVKGIAANIGAIRLSRIAADIHSTIAKGNPKDLMMLMTQYQDELALVKNEISGYVGQK